MIRRLVISGAVAALGLAGTAPGYAAVRPAADTGPAPIIGTITTTLADTVPAVVRAATDLGVIEPLIRQYSKPGALILDPFAGSGSIPAAALQLQRRAACLELKPDWAAKVQERLTTSSP